jgi:hypothetical protein
LHTLSELILWGQLLATDPYYYTIGHLIMIMSNYGLMASYFYVLTYTCVIDSVFLSVWDFAPQGCWGIDETPWTPDRVREWTIGGLIVVYMTFLHMIRLYDYGYYI